MKKREMCVRRIQYFEPMIRKGGFNFNDENP